MPDGVKALGGLALAVVLFFGINAVINRTPEPIRNVVDSPSPLAAVVEAGGELADGATSDPEDRFVAMAKQTTFYRAVTPSPSRSEMLEMGYWLCDTTAEERMLTVSLNFPEASAAEVASAEYQLSPLLVAAHDSELCGG